MKRTGYIYDKICDIDNVRLAIRNASKGKKKKHSTQRVLRNFEKCAKQVSEMLKNKIYKPNKYFHSKIRDGITKKERTIYKPKFFPDQVIHWCLMQAIEPLLKRGLYIYSCASIPGRGAHYAKRACEKWIRNDFRNTKYCLKIDIKKYYPSINKEKLKAKFRRIIKDKDCLWLIDAIIDSHHTGLPIGNYTSQWFANFYLQDADHYIKEKLGVNYYIRYMDDMCLFGPNKKKLHKIKNQLDLYFANEDLKIKENWQVFNVNKRPLDFVGFVFCRDKTFIRKKISIRMIKKARKVKVNQNFKNASAIMSYFGWLKHSNSYMLFKKYFKDINYKKLKGVIRNENRKIQNRG